MHQGKENTFQRNFVPLHHFKAAKYQLVLWEGVIYHFLSGCLKKKKKKKREREEKKKEKHMYHDYNSSYLL